MKILIAGDFCPTERVKNLIEKHEYEQVFGEVKPIIECADYSIVNLECPILLSTNATPIAKCGPNLKCEQSTIESLEYAGFDCVTLANNHFRDFGDIGCMETISALESAAIDYVGGGKNIIESQKILYKSIGNKVLAFVNFCEHEFSIATETTAGAAPLDLVDNYNQIIDAKNNSDYVIVIIHGGHEHFQYPSVAMKKIYRWFVDIGADAILNHHQHCFLGYEVYKEKPIFYGLGNFCFDNSLRRGTIWNQGYMVELELLNSNISFKLIPYVQCGEFPTIKILDNQNTEEFINKIKSLNRVMESNDDLKLKCEEFYQKNAKEWIFNLEPYRRNRLASALYRRGFLPSFVTTNKIKWLINFIECESQVTRFLSVLKKQI